MTIILNADAGMGSATDVARWSLWRYLAIFLAGVIFFIVFDLVDGQLFNGDPDDLFRALEIRTFIATAGWYDMTMPMIAGPEIYLSPWSRLVDLPYALIAMALQPFTDLETALHLAYRIWPAIMAALYSVLSVGILHRLFPLKAELPVSMLLAILILATYAIWEFSPGRIDHHNVQILLLLCMIYGISRYDWPGGLLVGAAVATATAIGLETLPLSGLTLVAVSLVWVLGFAGSRTMLQATGISSIAATLLLTVLLIRPSAYLTLYPDAFSAPFVQALIGFGLLAVLLPSIFPGERVSLVRGLVFAGVGAAIIAAILWQYPSLTHGPFPMIDALTRYYWFDRINQEMNALLFFRVGDFRSIVRLALIAAIVALCTPVAFSACRARAPVLPILYAIALAALLMVLASNRFLRLALAIIPLLLPMAMLGFNRLAAAWHVPRMALFAALATVLAVPVAAIAHYVPRQPEVYDAFDYLLMNDCKSADFSVLKNLPAGRIMTPPAIGLQILLHDPGKMTVSSVPFHRSSSAVGQLLRTFMAATATDRNALLEDFDYLALCRSPQALRDEGKLPLFAALMAGKVVEGLEPVAQARPGDLLLFRIDHDPLQ